MLTAQVIPTAGYSLIHLAIAVGAGICIGVLALFAGKSMLSPQSKAPSDNPSEVYLHQTEKRLAHRRQGRMIDLAITDIDRHEQPIKGWIIDRSTGGVKFWAEKNWEVGSLLCIRVAHLADAMPWIEVRVKHCKQSQKGWELGCQFLQPLTWNILLAFG